MNEDNSPSAKTTGDERKPWDLVCLKGKKFGGVISPELPKKEVAKFLADFVADGYSVVTVYNRDEYNALWEGRDFG